MSINPVDINCSDATAWERTLREAVRSLRYGSIELQVHDGRGGATPREEESKR
jgi:hypothetical protein